MTYIEQAIEEAVAKGQYNFEHWERDGLKPPLTFSHNETQGRKYGLEMRSIFVDGKGKEYATWVVFQDWVLSHKDRVFLDPTFWQAIGKARGWKDQLCEYCGYRHWRQARGRESYCDCDRYVATSEWKFQWHIFINHLAEGMDAESFFGQLLS